AYTKSCTLFCEKKKKKGYEEEEAKMERVPLIKDEDKEGKYPDKRRKSQATTASPQSSGSARQASKQTTRIRKKDKSVKRGKESVDLTIRPSQRCCPSDDDTEYWNLYYSIFNIAEEWSRNAKCTQFCFQLIVKMVCCANVPFYYHVLKYEPNSRSGYYLPHQYASKRKQMLQSQHKPSLNEFPAERDPHVVTNTDDIPFIHENETQPLSVSANAHAVHSASLSDLTSNGHLKVLTFHPQESYILKYFIKHLAQNSTKTNMLELLLQLTRLSFFFIFLMFIILLFYYFIIYYLLLLLLNMPQEFIEADVEWHQLLSKYLQSKIIEHVSLTGRHSQEHIDLAAQIFVADGQRNIQDHFVPMVKELLESSSLLER
ncbi:hypothetical protein RFI_17701, partial [Reticulomyxa filosa]